MEEGLVVDEYSEKINLVKSRAIRVNNKTKPPPFLMKTYMLVDDPVTDPVVSWNEIGTAFVVWQPAEFSRDLLPTLFKHSNFSSFVRQLNTYGFRKVSTTRWEFSNDQFQRDKRDLLTRIRRRKAHRTITAIHHDEDQRSSSTSSSSSEDQQQVSMINTLVDENKRLKRENEDLSSELASMKRKCKDLLHLVSIYGATRVDKEEEKRPKLFGVRLDVN